jgi:hypothetical protein
MEATIPLFGPHDDEKLKAKGNVNGLIKALGYDKDWKVRQDVAIALGQIGDTSALKPLIAVIKDKEEDVRKAAVEALSQIGDARAVKPLVAGIIVKDWTVYIAATEAVGSEPVWVRRAMMILQPGNRSAPAQAALWVSGNWGRYTRQTSRPVRADQ